MNNNSSSIYECPIVVYVFAGCRLLLFYFLFSALVVDNVYVDICVTESALHDVRYNTEQDCLCRCPDISRR